MKIRTELIHFSEALQLECGETLDSFDLKIESYGELNESKSNAILVCHAFSGNHHVAGENKELGIGWWDQIVGPKKAIDTDKYYVVCCNNLGGCAGSSGPTSINKKTGKVFGKDYPQVSVSDWVNSQKILMAVDADKDVDGFHPTNFGKMALSLPTFISATPFGIMELLKRYNVDTSGKHTVVIGSCLL